MATNYSEKLRNPKWQKRRLEILNRDHFTCRLCGDKERTLHVHHIRYDRGADPWDYPDNTLVTVCEACHEELSISKFGDFIEQSLIVGGARMRHLFNLMCAFSHQYEEGPFAKPMTLEQWDEVEEGITCALTAISGGMTGVQIGEAIDAWKKQQ